MDLDHYHPTFFDRLLKKDETKRRNLEQKVVVARNEDQKELEIWQDRVHLAKRILQKDLQSYVDVLQMEAPFDDIADLGSELDIVMDFDRVEVAFKAKPKEMIPEREKTLTAKGNVSTKNMSKTKRYDIYQDYVCSCVLRIAREFFALLPIDTVLIHVEGDFLDTSTGHEAEETILSVRITRRELEQIHFERIDCSDGVSSFPHNMKFLKTKDFQPVDRIGFN